MAITVPTSQPVCARSNFSPPPCLPSLRPFVSPLSPLLALCLLFCLLALACSCCLAWFPLLLHRWKLLSFTVLKRMRKRVATKDFVRRLRGSVSQNLILDLVRTSFAPRLKLQPVKTQPGEIKWDRTLVCLPQLPLVPKLIPKRLNVQGRTQISYTGPPKTFASGCSWWSSWWSLVPGLNPLRVESPQSKGKWRRGKRDLEVGANVTPLLVYWWC